MLRPFFGFGQFSNIFIMPGLLLLGNMIGGTSGPLPSCRSLLPRSLPPPPSPSYSSTTIISQPKNLYTFFMFAKVEVQFSMKPPQQSNIQKQEFSGSNKRQILVRVLSMLFDGRLAVAIESILQHGAEQHTVGSRMDLYWRTRARQLAFPAIYFHFVQLTKKETSNEFYCFHNMHINIYVLINKKKTEQRETTDINFDLLPADRRPYPPKPIERAHGVRFKRSFQL